MELDFGGRRSNISGSLFLCVCVCVWIVVCVCIESSILKRYMCSELVLLGFVTK